MTNHPNRGRRRVNPTPKMVSDARLKAGLTQTEAAALVHASLRAWQQWEAGDRVMHGAMWELFEIKAGRVAAGS